MQQTGLDSMAKRVPHAPADNPPKKRAPRQMPTNEILPDDLPAVFGHNLKVARLERAMTSKDVASAVGLTQQAISKIEAGKSGFTLTTMKKLADIFGLEVSGMLKLEATEPGTDNNSASHLSNKKNTL